MTTPAPPNPRIFVSHSHHDSAWCDPFVAALARAGVDVWYDQQGLYVGDQWVQTIERELQGRDLFLVVVTPDALESEWVRKELDLAIASHKRIVGVLHKRAPVSGFLKIYQVVDVIGQDAEAAAGRVLGKLGFTPPGPPSDGAGGIRAAPNPAVASRFGLHLPDHPWILVGAIVVPVLVGLDLAFVEWTVPDANVRYVGGNALLGFSVLLSLLLNLVALWQLWRRTPRDGGGRGRWIAALLILCIAAYGVVAFDGLILGDILPFLFTSAPSVIYGCFGPTAGSGVDG